MNARPTSNAPTGSSPGRPFTVVHEPSGQLRDLPRFLGEWSADVAASRTVAWRLFRRQLAQQYRHSSLGILWAFAPTALTALVIAGAGRGDVSGPGGSVPGAFYAVFGVALVQTFIESLGATRRLFLEHHALLRRQGSPLDGLVAAGLLSAGFNVLVRIVVIAAAFALFRVAPEPATVAAAVAGFLGVALLGAGLGLLVAPANALKRDLDHAFMLLPWVLFAVTPVFVPPNPGSVFGWICAVNPLSWIFDGIRAAAYGGAGHPAFALAGAALGVAATLAGWLACRVARPHLLERMLG